jgi:tetratricopeptide (TPR) repeat protein
LGPDHPKTATGLNNLAEFYRRLEKYEQAEPLFKRALAIREKTVGPDHFETATVLNNLALLYKSQGHYAEADSFHNLGELYRVQERYQEAEPLLRCAIEINERRN